jgi:hypothetical protein
MLTVELWQPSCKSISLPVDRKYHKGQSRDTYAVLLVNYYLIQNINVDGLM